MVGDLGFRVQSQERGPAVSTPLGSRPRLVVHVGLHLRV